jgi:hypothetical protein
MWSPTLLLVLSTVVLPTSAALVKEGSTCIVTPVSETPAVVVLRSIGALAPEERDLNPEDDPATENDLWAATDDPYAHRKPGSPGALGHYPRPEPGSAFSQYDARREVGSEPLGPRDSPISGRQSQPDDTPQILSAFSQCGKDGTIIFKEGTYHIRRMSYRALVSCPFYSCDPWVAPNNNTHIPRKDSLYCPLLPPWIAIPHLPPSPIIKDQPPPLTD